jgi:hypothetical protein
MHENTVGIFFQGNGMYTIVHFNNTKNDKKIGAT